MLDYIQKMGRLHMKSDALICAKFLTKLSGNMVGNERLLMPCYEKI